MENCGKLSPNYHQIPSLSVLLKSKVHVQLKPACYTSEVSKSLGTFHIAMLYVTYYTIFKSWSGSTLFTFEQSHDKTCLWYSLISVLTVCHSVCIFWKHKWASSWDYGTYHIGHQRRLLFAHMNDGSKWRVQPNIRHLAPLDGCTCIFEEWVYGGWKVP